jgi:hypothetical protein
MSRIAKNGAKPRPKKPWKEKSPYMLVWMRRYRAAQAGDRAGYDIQDAVLNAKWPTRGRKPLRVAKRVARGA